MSNPKVLGELGKSSDDNVSLRVGNRVWRPGRPPFVRAADERGSETFAAGRIEIEIMAGDHQDLVGRRPEQFCGALIASGRGL